MIVDDEPMIRQGLQSLIEWKKFDFSVVAVASNGLEALERYKEYEPDLILIDIRMPIMDGIRTIEELRKIGSQSRILILSGYGEFQYAQQAIRHGVDGYILKPIDEIVLSNYIEKLSTDLKLKQQEVFISTQTLGLHREEWLKGFVAQELQPAELNTENWNRLFIRSFNEASLLLLDTYGREHSLNTRNLIKQQLANFIEGQEWGYVFSTDTYFGILIDHVSFNQSKQERLKDIIELSCNQKANFIAVMGKTQSEISQLYEEVPTLKAVLKNRFFMHENELYHASDVLLINEQQKIAPSLATIVEGLSQKLYYVIDVGNKELLAELLSEISEQMKAYCSTEQQMKSSWAQLLTIVMNRIASSHPQLSIEDDMKLVTQIYLTHHYHRMLEQLQQQLCSLSDRLGVTASTNTTVMEQMIDFIDRHYAEPLRLETMAELLNYNSGYLGKMFKNHTGESFNTFLDKVRIDHAIEMLQEGKKVHQVAQRVGYANVDYFHSKFKKYKNVSPSTFKPGSASKKSSN